MQAPRPRRCTRQRVQVLRQRTSDGKNSGAVGAFVLLQLFLRFLVEAPRGVLALFEERPTLRAPRRGGLVRSFEGTRFLEAAMASLLHGPAPGSSGLRLRTSLLRLSTACLGGACRRSCPARSNAPSPGGGAAQAWPAREPRA